MELFRIGGKDRVRPALRDDAGAFRDLSDIIGDLGGDTVSLESLARIRAANAPDLPVLDASAPVACPLRHVPNFYCIGLNYARHAAETGAVPPDEPILFSKAAGALAGPYDLLTLPPGSRRADWEVELGVVIGAPCWQVPKDEALSHVSAYCVINDISERDFQMKRGGQWIKGKSAPGFGPLGPALVTADAVADPQDLRLSLSVNGEVMQQSRTTDMIFGVAEIISYMSHFMELCPGDVIATGTPEGVGMGRDRYLKDGDVIECEIDGLGAQRTEVRGA